MGDLFDHFEQLPTPKRRGASRRGLAAWSNLHAAFSQEFSDAAVTLLGTKVAAPYLLDPFVGSGTSLQSARSSNFPILASDLDPVAALLTRAKASKQTSAEDVCRLIRRTSRKSYSSFLKDADHYLTAESLAYASTVRDRISDAVGYSDNLVVRLIESPPGKFDDAVVALTGLMLAAPFAWLGRTSSNPTWQKTSRAASDSPKLADLAHKVCVKMMSDLQNEYKSPPKSGTRVLLHDARDGFPRTAKKPNLLITSPPYLTRIDYIKNHLPEIALLNSFQEFDIRVFRDKMIGTPTMPRTGRREACISPTAAEIVEKIRSHPSYMSEQYYMPFYRNYFESIHHAMASIKNALSEKAFGIIVVQQSRYKELVVDLPKVVDEQLCILGARTAVAGSYPVGSAYSRMNPRHANQANLRLFERAIYFEFSNESK